MRYDYALRLYATSMCYDYTLRLYATSMCYDYALRLCAGLSRSPGDRRGSEATPEGVKGARVKA